MENRISPESVSPKHTIFSSPLNVYSMDGFANSAGPMRLVATPECLLDAFGW
jgi:hypothetical protein